MFKKLLFTLSVMLAVMFVVSASVFAAAGKTGIITGDVVNFRAEPSISAKILDQLVKGTKVSVLDSEGEWYKVSYSKVTGWINDNYIVVRDEKISTGVVSEDVVNVRSKPTTSSAILAKLTKGTIVDIFEKSGEWYRISIGEENYGWMHSDYVAIREETVSRGGGDVKAVSGTGEVLQADSNAELRLRIVEYAKTLLGIKYVYGGSSTRGFDCSGFVSYVFKKFGISLERTSAAMGNGGKSVKKANLQPGDLVFFDTNGGLNRINHVGIYIGNNKFIHASSSYERKVKISSLDENFYMKTYMGACDYITK